MQRNLLLLFTMLVAPLALSAQDLVQLATPQQALRPGASQIGTNPGATPSFAPGDILLQEDFEGGIPGTFTIYDLDSADIFNTYDGFFPNGSWSAVNFTFYTSQAAFATSRHEAADEPIAGNNWMVLPQLAINEPNVFLIWDAISFNAPGGPGSEGYTVLVSTTGLEPEDFTDTLFTIAGENSAPTQRNADLTSYNGQSIYIAYVNDTPGGQQGNVIGIDNIFVAVAGGLNLGVSQIYTLGQVPADLNTPVSYAANVTNLVVNDDVGDVDVFLEVSGANEFFDTVTVTGPTSFATASVEFDSFIPMNPGTNTVTVSVGDDDDNSNNALTFTQFVTEAEISYANFVAPESNFITGFGGANPQEGMILTRYETNVAKKVEGVNVQITNLASNPVIGKIIYGVVLDADGAVIGTSDSLTVTTANTGDAPVEFVINEAPTVSGTFYVGVACTQAVPGPYFFIEMELETPTRPEAYYRINGSLGGASTATPLVEQLGTDRYMIEAVLSSPLNVQVIHNAPQLGFSMVDVYLNDELLLDDFMFRTATPFVSAIPFNTPFDLDIAPATSTSSEDAVASFDNLIFSEEGDFVVVAAQDPDDAEGVTLLIEASRRASEMMGNTDILAHHGSPDAPPVAVFESGINDPAAELVPLFNYTDFSDFVSVPTQDGYLLEVRDGNGDVVGTFGANLASLGAENLAVTVLASGYLTPDVDEPAFGLYAATPAGGPLVMLPPNPVRVQIIHNAPVATAATVDIYANDMLIVDDLDFREATAFFDAVGGVPTIFAIAPGTSTSSGEAVFTSEPITLTPQGSSIVVANSDSTAANIELSLFEGAMEMAMNDDDVDVLVHHGSADAPAVQVFEVGLSDPALQVTELLEYTEFDGYASIGAADDYELQLRDANGDPIATFEADLSTLGGEAITVVASGFVAASADQESFGLFVARASGGPMIPLSLAVGLNNDVLARQISVYPNPSSSVLNLSFVETNTRTVQLFVVDLRGRTVLQEAFVPTQASFTKQLATDTLAPGLYLIKVQTDEGQLTRKVMVR